MTERYLELATANDFEGLQQQYNENLSNGRTPIPDVRVVQAAIQNKNVEMFRYLMETMNAEWDISYFFEAAGDLECTKYIYDAWMKDEYWSGELPYILWQGHGIAQAAYKGSLECLTFFHTHGPKPINIIKHIGFSPTFISLRLMHMDCLQFCLDHGYSMFGSIDNVVEVLSALDMKKEIDWSIPLIRDKYFEIYKAYPGLQGRIAELIKPHYETFEKIVLDACEKWIPKDVIKHVLLCY